MRLSVVAACLSLCLIGISSAQDAHASIRKETNIPAEGLGPALKALAKDRNFQIVYVTEEIQNVRTDGAVGEFTTDEALKRLLTGTGLTFRYLDDKTITIGSATAARERGDRAQTTSTGSDDPSTKQEVKKSASGEFRLAQVDQGKDSSASSVGKQISQNNSQNPSFGLTEIVVTAQKRSENIMDVPVPVTVLNSQELIDQNQTRLQDFYSSVPGLNFTSTGTGLETLSIRGITTGGAFTNPTVGVTVDDVPFGPSNGLAFAGDSVPDIDPNDLKDLEVLRGPQGTLYGAASIGGVIKYVTTDPSTDGVSGRVQVDGTSVNNGSGAGYGVRGAVNVPISDTLAASMSGSTTRNPGYIDDPVTHVNGVNRTEVDSGRLAVLWKPSPTFSLKLSALLNDVKADGESDVNILPQAGNLEQSLLPGAGAYDQRLQLYSANIAAKLGGIDIAVVTGYQIYKVTQHEDYSEYYGCTALYDYAQPLYGVCGTPDVNNVETKKFSQEVRLSSSFGQTLDWLIGAFYTYENSSTDQTISAGNPSTGMPVGLLIDTYYPTTFSEIAAFGDITFHIGSRFDLQVGGRESSSRQRYNETDTGPLVPVFDEGPPSPTVIPTIHTRNDAFTYLITPQYKVSPDLMLYARVASGYRPGGPNQYASLFHFPESFEADKTVNYELGTKGEFFQHKLSFDASVYYINWRDIQVTVTDPTSFYTYFTNASSAKSEGVELSMKVRPIEGLTIGSWAAWNEAILTSNLPASLGSSVGYSGDELPYSSRWSANLSFLEEVPLSNELTGFAGGAVSYVGERWGMFAGNFSTERSVFPSYTRTDLRAGLRRGPWTLTGFVNNVTDKRGILNIFIAGTEPFYTYIQPRTLGVSIAYKF